MKIVIFTSTHDPLKRLDRDVTIALTVTPLEGSSCSYFPLAWKVLSFNKNESFEYNLELNATRRITHVRLRPKDGDVVDTLEALEEALDAGTSEVFASYTTSGAGLGVSCSPHRAKLSLLSHYRQTNLFLTET